MSSISCAGFAESYGYTAHILPYLQEASARHPGNFVKKAQHRPFALLRDFDIFAQMATSPLPGCGRS
jgi:hypothetical protein